MNNMIDLIPYLPQQVPVERAARRRKCFSGIAALVESVVTLAIGAGFFVMLLAFLSTM